MTSTIKLDLTTTPATTSATIVTLRHRALGLLAGGLLAPCLATPVFAAMPAAGDAAPADRRVSTPAPAGTTRMVGRVGEAIATDPEGRHLVAAWESIQGFCGPPLGKDCPPPSRPGLTETAYSADGGQSWVELGAPPVVDGAMTGGHPWLDVGGRDGATFFLANRARALAPEPAGFVPGGPGQVGITLHRGHFQNGRFSWDDGKLLVPAAAGDVWRSPAIAAAKDGSGRLVLAISNLRGICGSPARSGGQIEVLSSSDDGATWEGPVIVGLDTTAETKDPKDRLCGLSAAFQLAPSLALGPEGEVYLLWQFGPFFFSPDLSKMAPMVNVRFARSLDGGRTWSYPKDLALPSSLRQGPPVAYSKDAINDFPRLAVATAGPHRGRLYVTYASTVEPVLAPATSQTVTSSQVYLLTSDDRGKTWSDPLPLSPEPPPTGLKRLWPTVAVLADGTVEAIYLESQERQVTPAADDAECSKKLVSGEVRSGRVSSLVDLYRVRSTNGGASFGVPERLTSTTTNWCTVADDPVSILFTNFGDYLGLAAARERAFALWTDGRGGVPEPYFRALGPPGGLR